MKVTMVEIYLCDLTANKQDELMSAIDLSMDQLENVKPIICIPETVYSEEDTYEYNR